MVKWVWVGFVVLSGAIVFSIYFKSFEENRVLPIINPVDVNPKLVEQAIQNQGVNHVVKDFKLVNQYGDTVTQNNYENRIWVVNYFFTTCPSICPKMTTELISFFNVYGSNPNVVMLSHTVLPEVDSSTVLMNYAESYGVNGKNWVFLTGSKSELYSLARKSYLIVPDKDDPDFNHGSENDFVHTENVALIDAKRQIRGFYDGTNAKDVQKLIVDCSRLLLELNEIEINQ